MKTLMITKHKYMPLAEKIWQFIAADMGNTPEPEELANAVGALEAVKFGITTTLSKMGHEIQVFDMNKDPQ